MAVTDLTNTKWLINSVTCTAGYGQFSIKGSYYRNGESYALDELGLYIGYSIQPVFTPVATANHIMTWASALDVLAGDIVEFANGTDVTNASLISWLTSNATQITSGGSMYLGTSTISKMYLGQAEVSKVYFGQHLVYENEPVGFTRKYLVNDELSDMQQNKTYTVNYDSSALSVITYSNGAWQVQNIISSGQGLYIASQTPTSVTIQKGVGDNFYGRNIQYTILEGNTQATISDFAEYTPTTGLAYWACFVEGTKISLADGTTKNVEDVDYNDELLVWNFYDGKLDSAKPKWIMEEKTATEYKSVLLSDNTELKLVGPNEKCHRLFNITKQQMLYANECVGEEVYKQDGSIVRVVSCNPVEQEVKFYNLTTEKHLDCFANGVLTGSRLNNMYHITNMKYDSDERLISEEEEAERWAVRKSIGYKKY